MIRRTSARRGGGMGGRLMIALVLAVMAVGLLNAAMGMGIL